MCVPSLPVPLREVLLTRPCLVAQHRWSHFYASGREILAYLKRVAAKYKLERFLRFGHKLTAAKWNDDTKQWHLSFDLVDEHGNKHGEVDKVVDVVIQGMGGLNRWDWPAIPGIHDYKVRPHFSRGFGRLDTV